MTAVFRGPETRPVLAFAHANGIPGHSYDTFLAPFAGQFDVRVTECLGQDPAYPVDRGWRSLSRELEAFLAPLPKPLVGMGHSMGATLMFLVAERHPDWFRAVLLLDPPMANGREGLALRIARLLHLDRRSPLAEKSRGRLDYWATWDDVQSYFRSRRMFQEFDPRALDDYLEHGLQHCNVPGKGEGWQLRFRPGIEADIFSETPTNVTHLPRLKVPGVLITGEDSPPLFHRCGARHARRHRLTRLFAPGGHMYPLQHPEGTAELVLKAYQDLLADRRLAPTVGDEGKQHA